VVDDDPAVRSALRRALEMDRYRVEVAEDGQIALDRLASERFDAVVLDLNMPTVDGLAACRALRRQGNEVPILMLTARDAIDDRVEGLEAGADDYLVKPFALRELKARIKALLRRLDAGASGKLEFADLTMDLATHDVLRGERRINLSQLEFQLLQLFLENPRQVLSRSTIFERVWGYDFGATSNALGVYMGYLRKKTEDGGEPRLLHTVRGAGYILRDDA
jgi:two-component system response regulator MprA